MKQLVDFLPVAAFFGVYLLADIYYATMALMAASALQVAYFKLRGMKVTGQMWIVFWGAMIFGTMTLVFRNALFIQWRPSVVNWIMALALVGSRFIRQRRCHQAPARQDDGPPGPGLGGR